MKTLMKGMMYAAMVCILVMMNACGDGPTLSKHNVQALDLTMNLQSICSAKSAVFRAAMCLSLR